MYGAIQEEGVQASLLGNMIQKMARREVQSKFFRM
jgi:hypothetical protein